MWRVVVLGIGVCPTQHLRFSVVVVAAVVIIVIVIVMVIIVVIVIVIVSSLWEIVPGLLLVVFWKKPIQ